MAKSPFYAFRNTTLVFLVEDSGSTTDNAGNPIPTQKEVTLQAFMEPQKSSMDFDIPDEQGSKLMGSILKGYLVSPTKMPVGIKILDKTVKAVYMKNQGEFILTIDLPDPVGVDLITGDKISGIFRVGANFN